MINILIIIILITVVFSLKAFNDRAFFERFLFYPYGLQDGGKIWQFISHILIHADWGHLIFNMMSLYFLGDLLLKNFTWEYGIIQGQIHFLLIYLLGGFFASLYSFIRHRNNVGYRSLGASGAVSAVIFGCILWIPGIEISLLFIPIGIKGYILARCFC